MVLPRLDGHVLRRARLLEHFAHLPALTLLHAPLGGGKTTLVAQWAHEARQAGEVVLWLDGAVDRPHDVIEALARHCGGGPTPQRAGVDALKDLTSRLRTLDHRCVLLIDGFDPLAAELGAPLLDLLRRCPRLHLVLCLRERHDFMSDALIGMDHRTIGIGELALTPQELTDYAAAWGVDIDIAYAAEIVEATGGLPALIRAGLQRRPSGGAGPWSSDDVRRFVVEHARRLVGPDELGAVGVVAHLVDIDLEVMAKAAPERLERVLSACRRAGLLDHVAGDGLRLRMPPAMSETLRSLHGSSSDADLAEACDRVITELERSGRSVDAVDLARRFGRAERLFDLIKEYWWDLMAEDPAILAEALLAVPDEISQDRPVLMRYFAELLPDRLSGDEPPEPVDVPTDDEGLRLVAADPDALAYLTVLMLDLMAVRMRGDLPKARDAVRRGMIMASVMSADAHHELPVGVRRFFVQAGLVHLHDRDLDAAELAFRQGYGPQSSVIADPLRREAANKLALVAALRGDHDGIRTWIERATALPEPTGWLAPLIESPRRLASAIMALDELDREGVQRQLAVLASTIPTDELWFMELAVRAAASLLWGGRLAVLHDLQLARAERSELMPSGSLAESHVLGWEATLLISLGRGTEANALVSIPNDGHRLAIVRARLLVLTGRLVEAESELASVTLTAHGLDRLRLEALLLSAHVHHELGETDEVLTCLREAVRYREFVSSFLTVPRSVLDPWSKELPELGTILDVIKGRGESPSFPASVDVISLTERERRLIELLSKRQSRDAIARTLFVSTNTVKTQLRALYRKLGATSRSEAVTRAYALGLLT